MPWVPQETRCGGPLPGHKTALMSRRPSPWLWPRAYLVSLVDAVDELLRWRVPQELDGGGVHGFHLHVLRGRGRHCSRAAGGRRGLEGKERQAKPGELRAAGTTQPRGRGAWARTGQGRPLWGWQVTPQVEKGPRGGCRGVGTADGDEGQQVAELRQPHPGPDTGPGARAGDQGQGPRGSEATQASVRPADPAGVKRGSRQR